MKPDKKPGRLIVVSNRLPFQLTENKDGITLKESDGGLVSALKSYFDASTKSKAASKQSKAFSQNLWVGSADFSKNLWKKFSSAPKPESAFEVEPIFVKNKQYDKYYNGFSNSTLWPLFHYFPGFSTFDKEHFENYEAVNRQFADTLTDLLEPEDVLWVHDYQLMMVPGLVREKKPDTKIGFFMHIPFPNQEIFRMLHKPWQKKIIEGLLGADMIGFHVNSYNRHFRESAKMISGAVCKGHGLHHKDRSVMTETLPLGIDFNKFHDARQNPNVIAEKKEIAAAFEDKKIIFSVDRLDYTKGITHRLAGYEKFLETHPEMHEDVVFILDVVPSRQVITKYSDRRDEIEKQIGEINGKYSSLKWQPIIYRYSHLSFTQLTALYQSADVALITPMRDGMNLVAKEYVASQKDKGVLILSEFAGAADEMTDADAIQVNPLDNEDLAEAIYTALTMPADEQKRRIENMQGNLRENNVFSWVAKNMKLLGM